MKNIYVLPTDKPSRYVTNYMEQNMQWQHIYITNSEEIKEGDWALDLCEDLGLKNQPFKVDKATLKFANQECEKIILTTDQDLINDGVQAIDEEFLEWFINNSSCEGAEVQKWSSLAECGYSYHIIIPKEEPKKIYYNTVGRENGVNVVKGQFNTQKEALDLANELNRKFPDLYYDWRETLIKEEPKQETLEEFIDKVDTPADFDQFTFDEGIRVGAKWQAERMYSEEEVKEIILDAINSCTDGMSCSKHFFEQWFEQFKKK